ncbi:MAG TPA: protease HtpX [Elusimicrobia bacterium]|nr:MAG: zinc metalloprotease HtpX [Elusimicrobia bacterium GWA2_64_40]OGR64107.1 MAG: zinc metalloprotease HtpX [Elusimicrobia bacterium GWB2_63_16]HAN05783.1 protease HtpX [Elusimicrobiota bacterium]HAU90342.1 protease HtpX [Elusimicrobiota bacterium]
MAFAKRTMIFLGVNALILLTLSFTLRLLGIGHYFTARGIDYNSLLAFCLVWGMGGAFISLALSRVLAKWMMGVRVIDPNTSEPELRELVATVHRLASAAGLPEMPEVGWYPSPEVNAFATGPTRSRALVAVSAGLLERMDRSAVEGVLGHEIAHVANGDMVTMTLVQGVINALVMFLARVIAFFLANRGRSDDSSAAPSYFIIFILEMALSALGMIAVAAFSRYREYRADAGGAELAGRQKMIGALEALQRTTALVDLTGKESLATLKISGKRKFSLFATHPPLDERIARLKAMV